jgi:hypothetical protein
VFGRKRTDCTYGSPSEQLALGAGYKNRAARTTGVEGDRTASAALGWFRRVSGDSPEREFQRSAWWHECAWEVLYGNSLRVGSGRRSVSDRIP